jgi:TatD DNase family protein
LAAALPADRLLVETDAPYLSPIPHRGRRNEPAFVVEVARAVAGIRGVPAAELGRTVIENFRRLFRLNVAAREEPARV